MKRDFDLVRSIMAHIEKVPAGETTITDDICRHFKNEHDEAIIREHIRLLIDEELIAEEIKIVKHSFFAGEHRSITGLTWKGHDFVDAAKDDSIWVKAKETILKPTATITFSILLEWLKEEAKKKLGLS